MVGGTDDAAGGPRGAPPASWPRATGAPVRDGARHRRRLAGVAVAGRNHPRDDRGRRRSRPLPGRHERRLRLAGSVADRDDPRDVPGRPPATPRRAPHPPLPRPRRWARGSDVIAVRRRRARLRHEHRDASGRARTGPRHSRDGGDAGARAGPRPIESDPHREHRRTRRLPAAGVPRCRGDGTLRRDGARRSSGQPADDGVGRARDAAAGPAGGGPGRLSPAPIAPGAPAAGDDRPGPGRARHDPVPRHDPRRRRVPPRARAVAAPSPGRPSHAVGTGALAPDLRTRWIHPVPWRGAPCPHRTGGRHEPAVPA